ncbi:MAG: hypothetical protein R2847_08065 [Bacteroidia bacterium]
MDDDIDIKPFIRVHEGQKNTGFIAISIFMVCCFTESLTFSGCFITISKNISQEKLLNTPKCKNLPGGSMLFSGQQNYFMWLLSLYFLFIILGLADTIIGYVLMVVITGITIFCCISACTYCRRYGVC